MRYRPLGKTGLSVSEIGYGAWGIGGSMWIGAGEDESVAALRRAIELGVNFIDTARGYGESERIVGKVVREHAGADPVYVSTKVPPKNGVWPPPAGSDPADAFPVARSVTSIGFSTTRCLPAAAARTPTPACRPLGTQVPPVAGGVGALAAMATVPGEKTPRTRSPG
jgi:Aldo/keto reductase family